MKLKIIGHRGAAGLAKENTLESIKLTLKHKVDMIEVDVRSTKDSRVILHHDPDIKGKSISSLTYKQLLSMDADIATLEQALSIIPKNLPVNLDVKDGCDVDLLIRTLHKNKRTGEEILLSSFSFKILKKVREIDSSIPIAVLEKYSGVRASYKANQLKTKRLHFEEHTLWSLFIKLMSDQGWEIYAFTVNNPKRAKSLAKSGLKGIFTDFPDRF